MNIIKISDFTHVLLYALSQLEKNTGKKNAIMSFGEICAVCEAAAINMRIPLHPQVDQRSMYFHIFCDLRSLGKQDLVNVYYEGIKVNRIHLTDAGRAYVAKSIFADQSRLNKQHWPKHLQ